MADGHPTTCQCKGWGRIWVPHYDENGIEDGGKWVPCPG